MNQPNDDHRELQRQLDEAGRLCRPRDPGWDTLLERLPEQASAGDAAVSKPGRDGKPFPWRTIAMAAGILIAVVLGFSLLPGPNEPARAETLPIEVQRRGIQVTIFSKSDNREPTLFMPLVAPVQTEVYPNQAPMQQRAATQADLTINRALQVQMPAQFINVPIMQQSPGMALVKDQRMILHLQKGDNLVKFTDVAASIDPTSVRLVSDTDPVGTKVVEQNFEFDLASADALLKRSIEHKITCVGKEGKDLLEGYLLSFDSETIILADRRPSDDPEAKRPKTQAIVRNKLQSIRVDRIPKDLYTRPTLVWTLRTKKPGNHLTTLTYLCGNAVWRADYVAVITDTSPDRDTLDLKGWVTIDNRSGTTYENAGLKLIAGDVNRVRDPWAQVPTAIRMDFFKHFTINSGAAQFDCPEPKEFTEKSFFEYKLYTLNQPSTIKDRQIKQLSLFQATGIGAMRRYVCRSTEGSNLHPDVQLVIQNEEENGLGRPLPKGAVTLTAVDPDGDSQFLGRQEIDHTPKDEEVTLTMGQAFDVVYRYRIVKIVRPTSHRAIQTSEFRIRNHKPTAVLVRAIGDLNGHTNWKVTQSTDDYTKHDFTTLHFDVRLEPDSEKTITYTVDYRW